jgi:hypothetical protein
VQIRPDKFERCIVADVSIEFTIYLVARIADDIGPNLLTRLNITSENDDPVFADDGCVNSITRPRLTVEYRVGVGDEVFNAGRLQQFFDARLVRTFRKPNAARLSAEVLFVIRDGKFDLHSARLVCRDQGQKSVRCAARDDLERSFILQLAKGIDQFPL